MNYAALASLILKWANRPEIEPQIAAFFCLVDADLKRRLAEAGVAGGEGRDVAILNAGDGYSTAPDDLGRVIRMIRTADGQGVENISSTSLAALSAAAPDRTGAPTMFALSGGEFRYFPTPDADVEVELTYQRRHAGLSPTNTTNWIGDDHPDVYLTGVLAQTASYLSDDVQLARWSQLYERAVGGLITAERGRRGSPRSETYRADVPLGRDLGATGCL